MFIVNRLRCDELTFLLVTLSFFRFSGFYICLHNAEFIQKFAPECNAFLLKSIKTSVGQKDKYLFLVDQIRLCDELIF